MPVCRQTAETSDGWWSARIHTGRAGSQGSLCEAPSDIWELGKRSLHAYSLAFIWDLTQPLWGCQVKTDDVQVPLSQARTPVTQSKALPWSQETMLPRSSSREKKQAGPSASGPVWVRSVQRGTSLSLYTSLTSQCALGNLKAGQAAALFWNSSRVQISG